MTSNDRAAIAIILTLLAMFVVVSVYGMHQRSELDRLNAELVSSSKQVYLKHGDRVYYQTNGGQTISCLAKDYGLDCETLHQD